MKARELKAGDWFEFQVERYICVDSSVKRSLSIVCWNPRMTTCHVNEQQEVTPLPDCTGWDWEPEPETWYRGECLDPHMPCLWYQRYEDAAPMMADDYIGYTIRRVWPDGRVEQEFVPKGES